MSQIDVKPAQGHIEVKNFALSYETIEGSVEAVTDTQIHVKPGEFVSIVGPSGCGKSTLLNAVAGFLKPTAGTVTVDGVAVNGPSAERGMVFQQYSLFPWKTVRENVEFGLKMRGMARSQRERAARTLLGLAGLEAFEKHYPERLSGGMKQRVGIVRALATGPKVLLLDEPFGALDAQTRVIMQQILTNMWQRLKISVLFVTHDLDEAIFLSDRVYCMTARPGSIKAEIPIPLERPRQQSMMMSSEFLALRRGLMSLIRGEPEGDGRRDHRSRHAGAEYRAARLLAGGRDLVRHCEKRSNGAIHLCFAGPVIGRAFARPVGSHCRGIGIDLRCKKCYRSVPSNSNAEQTSCSLESKAGRAASSGTAMPSTWRRVIRACPGMSNCSR